METAAVDEQSVLDFLSKQVFGLEASYIATVREKFRTNQCSEALMDSYISLLFNALINTILFMLSLRQCFS